MIRTHEGSKWELPFVNGCGRGKDSLRNFKQIAVAVANTVGRVWALSISSRSGGGGVVVVVVVVVVAARCCCRGEEEEEEAAAANAVSAKTSMTRGVAGRAEATSTP